MIKKTLKLLSLETAVPVLLELYTVVYNNVHDKCPPVLTYAVSFQTPFSISKQNTLTLLQLSAFLFSFCFKQWKKVIEKN